MFSFPQNRIHKENKDNFTGKCFIQLSGNRNMLTHGRSINSKIKHMIQLSSVIVSHQPLIKPTGSLLYN